MLHLPARASAATPRGARMSRVAVLKGGRSLERQVSLRSGARVEDALERLGHDVDGIDVGHDLVARLRELAPDVAFVALHGRDGEDGTVQELLEVLGIPYTGSRRVGLHALRGQGRWPSTRCATPGCPTPDFFAFTETAFKELGAADALGAIEERLGFPIVVKPADQGSALGIRFARTRRRRAGARWSPRSPTPRRSCSSATSHGRDLAVSVLGDEALPIVEAVPRDGGLLRLRGALHDRAHDVRLPGRARRRR